MFVVAGYGLLRLGFNLLFHYRVSILLRAFSLLAYLSPLLLEGNLQYFFFLMFSQAQSSFSLSPRDKAFTALGVLAYFLVLWVSAVSCFLVYFFSRKLAKYVLDNWRTRLYGLLSFSLGTSLRMLLFGALHSLLRFDVQLQLLSLLAAEVLYIAMLCAVMKYWRAHRVEFKAWYTVLFALLRVVLIAVLLLQQHTGTVGSASPEEALLEDVLGLLLNLYMLTFYAATASEIIYEIFEFLRKDSRYKR